LKELKKLTIKTKEVPIKVCRDCWEKDHPQLLLGLYPVFDPMAVREPRPDNSYDQSGLTILNTYGEGSRVFQWGWNPVGGARGFDTILTPNALIMGVNIGTATVVAL
jgi:hypothetical protein